MNKQKELKENKKAKNIIIFLFVYCFRKVIFIVAIAINLGFLFYFKYFDFSVETINQIFHAEFELKNIVFLIGISFFSFQGMSYVIDVYRNDVKVQKNPLYIALYISMFPQLVAGPIVRYSDIEKEILRHEISSIKVFEGIERFTKGLFKKAVRECKKVCVL